MTRTRYIHLLTFRSEHMPCSPTVVPFSSKARAEAYVDEKYDTVEWYTPSGHEVHGTCTWDGQRFDLELHRREIK